MFVYIPYTDYMQYIIHFMKGIVLGITAITPGISFGTMALLLNVYERAITLFTHFFSVSFWKDASRRKEIVVFLVPLLIGGAVSVYVGSSILLLFFVSYTVFIQMFFIGIITASIPYFYIQYIHPQFKRYVSIIANKNGMYILWIIFGYLLVILLGSRQESREAVTVSIPSSLSEYIICFIIGVCVAGVGLMPGISGSYVLLLIGYYSTFLAIVSSVALVPLIWLMSGVVVGLVSTAFLVRFLFSRYPQVSYCVIFGVIVASLQTLFPWQGLFESNAPTISLWLGSIGACGLGVLVTICSMKVSKSTVSKGV